VLKSISYLLSEFFSYAIFFPGHFLILSNSRTFPGPEKWLYFPGFPRWVGTMKNHLLTQRYFYWSTVSLNCEVWLAGLIQTGHGNHYISILDDLFYVTEPNSSQNGNSKTTSTVGMAGSRSHWESLGWC